MAKWTRYYVETNSVQSGPYSLHLKEKIKTGERIIVEVISFSLVYLSFVLGPVGTVERQRGYMMKRK